MKRFLILNIVSHFIGLFLSGFMIALYLESGDSNAAGMYLVVYLMPIIGAVLINLFAIGFFRSSERKILRKLGLIICPLLLLSYSFFSTFFPLYVCWALISITINVSLAIYLRKAYFDE